MSKNAAAPAAPADSPAENQPTTVISGAADLAQVAAVVDTVAKAEGDMPKVGDRVMLEAVFGRMVNPNDPSKDAELDLGKITKASFDEWHAAQWKAGKIRRVTA